MSCDVTPRYVEADPYEGGKQAVAEAYRNLCAVGAKPLAVTDNLNFGNPQRPEIMGTIVAAIEGMAEACRALDFPVVSGNVSLYNETMGEAILPTPAIGGVGLIENLARRGRADALEAGDLIVLIGADAPGWLGQSMYLREVLGRDEGAPPPVDLAVEQAHGEFVRALIADGLIDACHDLSDGGLGCAAAEMALAGDVGVALGYQGEDTDVAFVFGEAQARYLIGLKPARLDESETRARDAGIGFLIVGEAGGRDVSYLGASGGVERIALAELRRLNEAWLPSYMEGRQS
jgi:phosphoribosylformylglycinamidine synthase